MHLFAAQPGGFSEDEGIIDLAQTPADIIFLSAADSALSAMSSAVDRLAQSAVFNTISMPSVRLANWMNLIKPAAFDLYHHKVLEHATVIVVSLLGGQGYWQYGFEQLVDWSRQSTPSRPRHLILVPGDDATDNALFNASTVEKSVAIRVWRYLREGGQYNNQQLMCFLSATFLKRDVNWKEPRHLPLCSLYWPKVESTEVGDTDIKKRSACLLVFYRSHLQSANTDMFDDLIHTLRRYDIDPIPVAVSSLKDETVLKDINHILNYGAYYIAQQPNEVCVEKALEYYQHTQESADKNDIGQVELILNTTGFATNRVSTPDLSSEPTEFNSIFGRNIPVLQLVLSSSTFEDWQSYSQGLRSRDIAMQVVLPEMDGKVITRSVSFKSEAQYDERCQTSIVQYSLYQERANFIAQLAYRYAALSKKENAKKRTALILANYPTKDGRIGNGVGLDTPQSTVNILAALKQNGYPIGEIPSSGTELIQFMLGSITNNPNTLHHLPCWQSLSLEDYYTHFAQLPEANQQAVLAQWGTPDLDPKCRNNRIMIAGVRFGETFVGIQPARGFDRDLLANYHDPDLVPPHSYLAFYFWLRHVYQVDALVHIGKHGNLEWLPGKGTALSDTCWPDIALGPMPHFYPFIVNDPGEGAQAKRRAQAVIIDHLMPPMARAETYGVLSELESLVDEYYQALGLDIRREEWLKENIVQHIYEHNIVEEIRNGSTQHYENDNDLMEDLDAYLCDIKEAQIRNGLHVLGQLPEVDKLIETLVALVRLPRGDSHTSQGILQNLVLDLEITTQGETFDPFNALEQPWQGDKPALLNGASDALWRTAADTRERLEIIAAHLVGYCVFDIELPLSVTKKLCDVKGVCLQEALEQCLPRTSEQLIYIRRTIFNALRQSELNEIQALIDGLAGIFVPPGPSGAPTRGRLDTLPTGRNFYSVDNRSIPSPAAWALGQKSAQALIERHLQEHGEYPTELGLSVWGTATMRTGGDDIAQAFALMGVKPIWAEGSHRVVDFEITPTMLMQRPRVDVTLRVSGFFRDAFPNVMRLFDAAVKAIAELDEPGFGNTIRNNVLARQTMLVKSGVPFAQAGLEASYRVFGSKPGAYGAGLQGLIDERCWEQSGDLAEAYVNWGGYAYGQPVQKHLPAENNGDGIPAHAAFQYQLSQIKVVVQNQDNREHDLLDSDDYYQFQGGMTNAVTEYSLSAPQVYHSDHSDPSAPKIRTLKEELNRVIRSRVINPKWISSMREHGYKGAFEMAASVDYLFAYDATTKLIDDYQYENVTDALILDSDNQQFLKSHNPAALEEMAERMLEAIQRNMWEDKGAYHDALQTLLLTLDEEQEAQSASSDRPTPVKK